MYVSCPLHKRNFALKDGKCLNDDDYRIITFDVKEEDGDIFVYLPEKDALEKVLGTSKFAIGGGCSDSGRSPEGPEIPVKSPFVAHPRTVVKPNFPRQIAIDGGQACTPQFDW